MRHLLLATLLTAWMCTGCTTDPDPTNPPPAQTDGGETDGGATDPGTDGGGTDGGGTDGGTCQANGGACTTSVQCCSGACSAQGVCEASDGGGTCSAVGQTCASGVECCTGLCQADSAGAFRCASGSVCAAEGASCSLARDCCSLSCVGGKCGGGTTDGGTTALCVQTGQSCNNDPGSCCTGQCGTDGMCVQPTGSSCTVAGDKCSTAGFNSSCCSKVCVNYGTTETPDLRCGAAGVCRSQGEPCSKAENCCSNVCGANGLCAAPPVGGQCLVVGSACQALSDCCSGLCNRDSTGFQSCEYLGGCRPENELCRRETDCCGYAAANKGSEPVCQLYPDAGIGRCRSISGGNAPPGEICPSTNSCAPDNTYCKETIFGVERCVGTCDGGPCSTTNCRGPGQDCLIADQCCSGICSPSGDGGFACASACVTTGLACTANSDCCSGQCSLNGTCVTSDPATDGGVDGGTDAGPVCGPIASVCTSSTQCCSGFCDTAVGRCQSTIN